MLKCKKKDCFYRSGGTIATTCCHYLLWTGQLRGCPPETCDKYISMAEAKRLGMKKPRSLTEERSKTEEEPWRN